MSSLDVGFVQSLYCIARISNDITIPKSGVAAVDVNPLIYLVWCRLNLPGMCTKFSARHEKAESAEVPKLIRGDAKQKR